MKKKVLALAGCIAASAPTNSIANVLPDNLVGLNLGEISSSSFLNQPFKGVIPFLFTSYEKSKNLKVRLAPEFIFNEIGAEKDPILNSLNFQVTRQNNKPVILISSTQPIQLPFLNFVLEIEGPQGSVYQDYTVLLDPASKQVTTPDADYITIDQVENNGVIKASAKAEETLRANGTLLLANLSSRTVSANTQSLKYKVRSGDSLFKIAQAQNTHYISVKSMSRLIFQKNPSAFIRGDVNRIKKGALLDLPSLSEINGFELANDVDTKTEVQIKVSTIKPEATKVQSLSKVIKKTKYTVVKGDSLSKITKQFATKDTPFAEMMNVIHRDNPEAFINNSKNIIKAGAELTIPLVIKQQIAEQTTVNKKVVTKVSENVAAIENTADLNSNQYRIATGDTLSSITKNIGYKEVPFAKMLKAIYLQNPNAFIDGNMTKMSVGEVITLPAKSEFNIIPAKQKQVSKGNSTDVSSSSSVALANSNAKPTDLIRRIRQLRQELKQSKKSLSNMKSRLKQKETLLQQKNMQLDALKITLTKLNENTSPELVATAAITVKELLSDIKPADRLGNDIAEKKKLLGKSVYKPRSKAELAKLKRELIKRQEKTNKQLEKIKELKDKTLSENTLTLVKPSERTFKNYDQSSIVNFARNNYSYLTIALLLTLLLVRYRRELYSYTYSTINYDQPKYYPIPETDKYELKETNINYHDAKMDEDAKKSYETLPDESQPTESSVVINPLLVEATEEIFAEGDDQKEIEHCEHLVTELFDDLNVDEEIDNNSEWNDIEKVCDTYIDKIKEADSTMAAQKNGALVVEEATDFNHMMSDLLESLDKVDKRVRKNNISDDLPDLSSAQAELTRD